jgi:hypothetical protein
MDDPRAAGGADHIAQERLPVLDRAAAQIVAVEVQQVEGEIDELVGAALGYGFVQGVDVGDAALIGHGNLAVEHHRRQPGLGQRPERLARSACRAGSGRADVKGA